MIKAYMNWSGGKDSALALHRIIQNKEFNIDYLLTSVNKAFGRISMHGVRIELLYQQAQSLGIPLKILALSEQPTMNEYEHTMRQEIEKIKKAGIFDAIFGDIFLEDLRQYREDKLLEANIQAHFPLWKIPTIELMHEFINLGFKAIIVCVNETYLDKSFCGRLIDQSLVDDLPANVDICGENGEYHSFVFDGPIFKTPIAFTKGEIVHREYKKPIANNDNLCSSNNPKVKPMGFYFCDLY